MTKPDLINAIGILLSLSKEAQRDLQKLEKKTLEDIFYSYKQNALNAANAVEAEAANARKHASAPCRRSNRRTTK